MGLEEEGLLPLKPGIRMTTKRYDTKWWWRENVGSKFLKTGGI
jgi:hypothetical protein